MAVFQPLRRESRCAGKVRRDEDCGRCLEFRKADEGDRWFLAAGKFCQAYKLCNLCGIRRTGKYIGKVLPVALSGLLEQPNRRLTFATHTIRDSEHLGEQVKRLLDAYRRLMTNARKAREGKRGYSSPIANVVGSMGFVELKRGKNSGKWHPHIHSLWLHDGWLDYQAASDAWRKLDPDTRVSNHKELNSSRTWRCNQDPDLVKDETFRETVAKELAEIMKYVTAFSELSAFDVMDAFYKTKGQRLVRGYGRFFRLQAEPEIAALDPGAPDWEQVAFDRLMFEYLRGEYRQVNPNSVMEELKNEF